ncbi:MAG TPA: alpha/beta hydrolase [Acidimicrobiales bacterium]|nr:alpha/beta hydrolase [Acidimicrobiales bacterium]
MPVAVTTDGVRVAFTDLGGTGDPILFAHATGFHGHVWRPVAAELRDAFHGVTFDERGHGDTAASEAGQSWLGFARDALAVVDEAGLDGRPFGVGHSAGGAALLLTELERPGTFRGLWCYEPILPPPRSPDAPPFPSNANPLAAGARRRREVFPSRAAAFENYAGKPPFSVLDRAALRAYVEFGFDDLEDGTVRLKCRGEVEAATYEMAGRHGAVERLAEIACPVVFASGAHTDTPFGPDLLGRLVQRMPDARSEVFDDLGHFGPLQDPAAIAASIRRAFSS